ncbi:MAG TPA: DUF952 domain-containing protein [Stackebrandtia sp.]|jgi:uncharacterized protein (DUF952 family)|uniref:DUF952 domain-containing protein n=1 Tax=Stackebrandtia sp. TaxID=2023065 RepID=UPI002D36CE43|nr:DUF952 domain-containing protein [Stackebrandtia sp.]HZE41716.1 DUF952 domain-containing protein [Stackebrandtia sp.]
MTAPDSPPGPRSPVWFAGLRVVYAVLLVVGGLAVFVPEYRPETRDGVTVSYGPLLEVQGPVGMLVWVAFFVLLGLMVVGIFAPARVPAAYAGLAAALALLGAAMIVTRLGVHGSPDLSAAGVADVVVLVLIAIIAFGHAVTLSSMDTDEATGGESTRLLHLTERRLWKEAVAEGSYRWSTRGKRLEEEGFIHTSLERQLGPVAEFQYGDRPDVDLVVLVIDHAKLGAVVRYESPGLGEEKYPHIYGPIPVEAVVEVRDWHWPGDD